MQMVMYSSHVEIAAVVAVQVAHRCNHPHRQASACMMTTDPHNGLQEPAVCQDDGKHSQSIIFKKYT